MSSSRHLDNIRIALQELTRVRMAYANAGLQGDVNSPSSTKEMLAYQAVNDLDLELQELKLLTASL